LLFTIRRVAATLVLVFLLSLLIFAGTEVLPGDAATAILGRHATPESLAAIREKLNLDQPVYGRYMEWVSGLLHGDLGESLTSDRAVSDLLASRLTNTLILAAATLLIMIPVALALGVLAGIRPDRFADHAISWLSLVFISVPEFVTGTLLAVVFAGALKLVPPVSLVPPGTSPFDNLAILVLPVLTLVLASLAYTVRMLRASVIEVMRAEYVEMARLNGLKESRVILKHVLRNALAPTIQVTALTVSWIVGGVIIVEAVFQYPGIGQALVESVAARDIPVVQSVALLIAAFYIVLNIVADLLVVLVIPRLRTGQ
jgi:peptide/nickel transport system permease protein